MGAMKPAMLSARVVAQQGYAGLMAGKRIVIPGVVNKLLVFFARLTPRALLLPILAAAQKNAESKNGPVGPFFQNFLFFGRFNLYNLTTTVNSGL